MEIIVAQAPIGRIQLYRQVPGDLGIPDIAGTGDLRALSGALEARFKDDTVATQQKPLKGRLISDTDTTVMVVMVDLDGTVKLVDGSPDA